MVVLIVTGDESGVDKYSQEIAKRLDVKKITTRRYHLSLVEAYKLGRLVKSQGGVLFICQISTSPGMPSFLIGRL